MKSLLDRCEQIPLEKLTSPRHGSSVIADHWWVVVDGNVLVYRVGNRQSPQCNSQEVVARRLASRLYPGSQILKIPVAYF